MSKTNLAKLMDEDIDVAVLKVKLRRALEVLHRGKIDKRKRALHVSDFTASEKQFCYRRLVRRYLIGDEKKDSEGVSWVQYDGKFREEKWKRLFEAAGMLRSYQLELKLGPLVGHPDFLVGFDKGVAIVELTGQDETLDPILRNARVAQKKRQCLTYVIMYVHTVGPLHRGFVIVEGKGSNEFKVIPIDYDKAKAADLLKRVVTVSRILKAMDKEPSDKRSAVWEKIPKCGRKNCSACSGS